MPTALQVHNTWFLSQPTPTQERLYHSGRKGFAGAKEEELADATIILALAFTYPRLDACSPSERVLVLTPDGDRYALERIRSIVKRVVVRTKSSPLADFTKLKRCLTAHLGGLFVVSRDELPAKAPNQKWVALGYSRSDPLPGWLQSELINP
jgi:hypothetical protein